MVSDGVDTTDQRDKWREQAKETARRRRRFEELEKERQAKEVSEAKEKLERRRLEREMTNKFLRQPTAPPPPPRKRILKKGEGSRLTEGGAKAKAQPAQGHKGYPAEGVTKGLKEHIAVQRGNAAKGENKGRADAGVILYPKPRAGDRPSTLQHGPAGLGAAAAAMAVAETPEGEEPMCWKDVKQAASATAYLDHWEEAGGPTAGRPRVGAPPAQPPQQVVGKAELLARQRAVLVFGAPQRPGEWLRSVATWQRGSASVGCCGPEPPAAGGGAQGCDLLGAPPDAPSAALAESARKGTTSAAALGGLCNGALRD
ncbi:hypothetical protein CYMTET_35818 [Cymbomonas tetramitiformis]|uniref:Uncharacterized protein n=1 Tax=Cymbomonas tetramitiformis TaxID=36881 RepID=A0AAE0KN96_9CHLO|nr:hypothetical protein CYMTET_35818 [Cymbomonas tetramitiformis]